MTPGPVVAVGEVRVVLPDGRVFFGRIFDLAAPDVGAGYEVALVGADPTDPLVVYAEHPGLRWSDVGARMVLERKLVRAVLAAAGCNRFASVRWQAARAVA